LILQSYVSVSLWHGQHAQWKQEKAGLISGDLEAQDYGLLRPEDPLLIRIGDGESTLKYTGPIDQDIFRSPSGIAYYEHFALERDKGKILISATVHDVNHNLVATIEKNHWRLERQGISDKNYSDDSLEIKDLQGRVIFQIRLLAKEVRLQWEWARSDTRTGGIMEDGKYSLEKGITPMFKYPSEEFWGELSGNYSQ